MCFLGTLSCWILPRTSGLTHVNRTFPHFAKISRPNGLSDWAQNLIGSQFQQPKSDGKNLRYVSCSVSFVAVPLKKKNSRIWSNYSICSFILKNDDNASAVLTFEELRAKRLSFDRKPNDRKWKSIRMSIETSLNEFKRLFDEKNNSNNKSRSSSSFLAFSYIAKVSKRLGFLCRSNNWFLVCGESEKEREITKVDYQSLWCAHTHTLTQTHIIQNIVTTITSIPISIPKETKTFRWSYGIVLLTRCFVWSSSHPFPISPIHLASGVSFHISFSLSLSYTLCRFSSSFSCHRVNSVHTFYYL